MLSEFMRSPEKRKAWECDRRVGGKVTRGHTENYYRHQATVVTQCLRGLPLTPDTLKYNEVDTGEEEDLDEVYEQDT